MPNDKINAKLGGQLQEMACMWSAVAGMTDCYAAHFVDLRGERWVVVIARLDGVGILWADDPKIGWGPGMQIEAVNFERDTANFSRDVKTWLEAAWLAAMGSEFDGCGV
jgi:hypothetical protein